MSESTKGSNKTRPARTREGREKQLISLAVDLAEKQLREGTASAQVITHYLKLATTNAELEKEILVSQKMLLEAKTEALQSQKKMDELYGEAIQAMKTYKGEN